MPESCCPRDMACPSDENPLFDRGCFQSLANWTSVNLSIIAAVALVISIVQVFGTTFSCLLARSIKRRYEMVD